MSQFIYSIYDLKGCCHDRVFCCVHDSDAVRLFDQLVFSEGSPYRNYGEDYVLCLIGSFDPSSGSVVSLPVKQLTTVMERQVFFESLQRIRELKTKNMVAHERPCSDMPSPEMPSPEMPSPEMPSPEMPSPEMPSPEMPSPEVI